MESITLRQVLDSRDRRHRQRCSLIKEYNNTIISLLLNIPGHLKDKKEYRDLLIEAFTIVEKTLKDKNISILFKSIKFHNTGPEAIFVVDAQLTETKKMLIQIEDYHELGRLFDFDVYDSKNTPISRTALNFEERKCFICNNPAKVCARNQTHSLADLLINIEKRIANRIVIS
jgi:holo-ACP synthase